MARTQNSRRVANARRRNLRTDCLSHLSETAAAAQPDLEDLLAQSSRPDGFNRRVTAPRSPWQNPYAERLIGSIRRECLDHFVILNARHLKRTLSSYFAYYHGSRTHLGLNKQCPHARQVSSVGRIVKIPHLGDLHHRCERIAMPADAFLANDKNALSRHATVTVFSETVVPYWTASKDLRKRITRSSISGWVHDRVALDLCALRSIPVG